MMRRSNQTIVFSLLFSLMAISLVAAWRHSIKDVDNGQFIEFPPTPIVNSTADNGFLEVAALNTGYELNAGLTIERINTMVLEGVPTPSPNYISLLILNHTEEPIVFNNIGFGIQLFQYDLVSNKWVKAVLPYMPEERLKILPPRTEKFDFQTLNIWELRDNDLVNVHSGTIRILIVGVGSSSEKHYGAYIDLLLPK